MNKYDVVALGELLVDCQLMKEDKNAGTGNCIKINCTI